MTRYSEAMHVADYKSAASELLDFLMKTTDFNPTDAIKPDAKYDLIAQRCGANLRITKPIKGSQCEFGRYDEDSCTITVYECSNKKRNLFSFFHELAHHAQSLDSEWADDSAVTLLADRRADFKEKTANQFASLVLIPENIIMGMLSLDPLSATLKLNTMTPASWTVIIKRVCGQFQGDFALALCDASGKVLCCDSSHHNLAPPGKDSIQPQVGHHILDCGVGETLVCRLSEGIKYSTGKRRADLNIRLYRLDERTGLVMFKDNHSQHTCRWIDEEWICPNPACGHTILSKPEGKACSSCGQMKCPECHECGCKLSTTVCPDCHMILSPAEQADFSMHDCYL